MKTISKKTEARLVDGFELLNLLFSDRGRPSQRWLFKQKELGRIPFIKISHRIVRYDPDLVRAALAKL